MCSKLIFTLFLLHHGIVNAEWKAYDDPSAPARDGISAGLNEFGKESYVGRGTFDGQLAPGKLMTEATSYYTAALYFAYDVKEYVISSGIEYYAKESSCDYRWVPSSNGQVVANAIQFTSGPYTFYPGRSFSFGSTQVGKVTLEHHVMYYAYDGKSHSTPFYEVLTCEKIIPTTTFKALVNPLDNELLALNTQLSEMLEEKIQKMHELFKETSELKKKLNECEANILH